MGSLICAVVIFLGRVEDFMMPPLIGPAEFPGAHAHVEKMLLQGH